MPKTETAAALKVVEDTLSPKASRKSKVPELFGYFEACECIGVSRTNLRFVKGMPEPVADLSCGRIWRADDVREFAKIYNARRVLRRS